MLQHFSWQQFLIAAVILTLVWYVGLILLFYRKTITDLLNGKKKTAPIPEPLPHVWDDDYEEVPSLEEESLMGKSAPPDGMSTLSMAQFGFAPRINEPAEDFVNDTADEDRQRQQSVVPDVLEELKSIFHILESKQSTKADFISLFALVSAKYPSIKGTSNEQALNDHIRENLPFSITDEELDSLWV